MSETIRPTRYDPTGINKATASAEGPRQVSSMAGRKGLGMSDMFPPAPGTAAAVAEALRACGFVKINGRYVSADDAAADAR